jgi:glycosyltransferase involved in cell wall biosynthesis
MSALRILLLSDTYPWPLNNGAIQRIYHLITRLAAEHQVTLLAGCRGGLSRAQRAPLEDLGICVRVADNSEVLDRPGGPYGLWRPLGRQLMDMLRPGLPMAVQRWWSDAFVAQLAALRRCERYDLVWAERAALGEMAKAAGWESVLVDMPDLDSQGAARAIASLGRYHSRPLHQLALRRLFAYERALPSRFAHVVVCKPEDRTFMQSQENVTVVPNGAEVRPPVDARLAQADDMLFLGSMGYPPNIDAATYFAGEILPRIREQRPMARFSVVGKETANDVRRLHDGHTCIVHGEVSDVAPHYAAAGLVVAPIRLGAGTRLKVLEALMFGKAVVATSIAIEGLELRPGIDLEVADTPETFAQTCLALMHNETRRRRLGDAGRRRVCDLYDWSRIGRLAVSAAIDAVRTRASASRVARSSRSPVFH